MDAHVRHPILSIAIKTVQSFANREALEVRQFRSPKLTEELVEVSLGSKREAKSPNTNRKLEDDTM